jgi:Uma2 family endonuclease
MSGRNVAHEVGFGPYTVLDLHDLPEDGKGFELEDGWLIEVAAGSRHNWVARNVSRIVEAAATGAGSAAIVCGGGEWEISTPAGVRKPDVFVIPREVARAVIIDESPKVIPGREVLLAVEVVSAGSSSERNDRVRKVGEYAAVGIPQYWIVDYQPYPRVRVLKLGEQEYIAEPVVNAGTLLVTEIKADKPFTVSLDPATLLEF